MTAGSSTLFGIDLGTTNSAISVLTSLEGTAQILRLKNGKTTLPSCVMWTKEDGFTVGKEAYDKRWMPNVVYSIKRHMGTEDATTLTDSNGNTITLTPEEVSAEILKELARNAEELGYGEVKNVTITVPAYFDNNQRAATFKAGELAGFNPDTLHVINEPTSASLSYGLDKSVSTGNVLVYDLGGGTMDATLLKIEKIGAKKKIGKIKLGSTTEESSVINVLSNGGNNKLGGDDIDDIVLRKACRNLDDLLAENGHTVNTLTDMPKESVEKLKAEIERIKKMPGIHALTATVNTVLSNGLAVLETIPITMKMIDDAVEEVFQRSMIAVTQCIETSSEKNFGKIILVGGSTKSTKLVELLTLTFPDKIIYNELNPDESVAVGAAIMSGIKSGAKGIKLFDVIPLPIGIRTEMERGDGSLNDNKFSKIINKDTPIPASARYRFTNAFDDGSAIKVEVYQGTKTRATANAHIGTLTIDTIPAKPVGQVEIIINMLVDVNGMLSVKAIIDGEEHVAKFNSVFNSRKDELQELPELEPLTDYSDLEEQVVEDLTGTATVNKQSKTKAKDTIKIVSMSDNPKIKRWTENLYRWDLTEDVREEALILFKQMDKGEVEEKVVIDFIRKIKPARK